MTEQAQAQALKAKFTDNGYWRFKVQCEDCGGEGYEYQDRWDYSADCHYTDERPCPSCEGEGYEQRDCDPNDLLELIGGFVYGERISLERQNRRLKELEPKHDGIGANAGKIRMLRRIEDYIERFEPED